MSKANHFQRKAATRHIRPKIEKIIIPSNDLPKVNMVFHGPVNWTFEKILYEYRSRLEGQYNIIPSENPISGCDVYQFFRPASVAAQRMNRKLPANHEFFLNGIHMIHDSPYDIKRHNTDFRLSTISKYRYIMCTSKEQYDFYYFKINENASIRYIPLGFFEDKIRRALLSNKLSKIRIGFIARLYPDRVKGEDLLLEIASNLDPNKFEFVIDSPNAQRLVDSLKVNKFTVLSNTQFDVLLICSKYEGTPFPLLEALAGGTYVLSTRVGEARWLLPENQLCSSDANEFVEKLNRIEENRNILKDFIERGQALVKGRTWDNHINQMTKLWDSIINPIPDKIEVTFKSNIKINKKKRVFIVGGAPSVSDVDLSLLKKEDVICVNKSIELFENPTHFITMDYTFFSKIDDPNLHILEKAKNTYFILNTTNKNIFVTDNKQNVLIDKRNNIRYAHLDKFSNVIQSKNVNQFGDSFDNFAHGENSGFCAIQLALLLGYEEINLIGFDVLSSPNAGNRTHYHDGYNGATTILHRAATYQKNFEKAFLNFADLYKIRTITPSSFFEKYIKKISIRAALGKTPKMKKNLMVVGYYTVNTPYEKEAEKLLASLNKIRLKHDIVPIETLGNWQANTRFKAKFMEDMLIKHKDYDLLYVDADAVFHKKPELFTEEYDYDIAVRWQDFRWRKNECLSGTIYMANNEKTLELCKRWQHGNEIEGSNAKTYEQWNLGRVIVQMRNEGKIRDVNLPPEYTMIFDSMRAMYPNIEPVIEHFQASRTQNEQRQK